MMSWNLSWIFNTSALMGIVFDAVDRFRVLLRLTFGWFNPVLPWWFCGWRELRSHVLVKVIPMLYALLTPPFSRRDRKHLTQFKPVIYPLSVLSTRSSTFAAVSSGLPDKGNTRIPLTLGSSTSPCNGWSWLSVNSPHFFGSKPWEIQWLSVPQLQRLPG